MFGYGDGGSGATEEMIELMHRFDKLSVMPKTEQTRGTSFLEKNLKEMKILLCGMVNYIWKCTGDIHNEINLKRENRELEFALREAELLLSLRCLSGETYPVEQVRDIYKVSGQSVP